MIDVSGQAIVDVRRSTVSRARRAPITLQIGAIAVVVLALGPLGYLAERAVSEGWREVRREIFQRRTFDLVVRSMTLVVTVTTLATLIGVGAAIVVVRTDVPLRRILRVALALPLAIPTYVAAYTWVAARPSIPPFGAALLVLTLCCYPYVYLPVLGALAHLDPAHEEVARSLGCTRWTAIRSVVLPGLRNSITSGALLVALYVLSDFGAVATVRYEVFTWVIYGAYSAGFNPARAAILSLVLVAASVLVVGAEWRARGDGGARVGGGASRMVPTEPLGALRFPALVALCSIVGASAGFPLVSLVRWLVSGARRGIDVVEVGGALGASVRLSVAAALLTTVLAFPIGLLVARHRTKSAVALERAAFVAHALPGVVIGISMVYVGTRLLRPIYQRTPLLVVAYAVLSLPLAVATAHAAFERVPPVLDDVARSLGHGATRAFLAVTARLAMPGIAAGAALVFLATMKELPATLLLHPTGMETLATRLWQRTSVSDFGGAAPFAVVLVLFSALPTALLGRWIAPSEAPSEVLL
jgi:iron(III) transport system permease protein